MKLTLKIGNIYKYIPKDVYIRVVNCDNNYVYSCVPLRKTKNKDQNNIDIYYYVFSSKTDPTILKLISDVEELAMLKLLGYNL